MSKLGSLPRREYVDVVLHTGLPLRILSFRYEIRVVLYPERDVSAISIVNYTSFFIFLLRKKRVEKCINLWHFMYAKRPIGSKDEEEMSIFGVSNDECPIQPS